MEYRVQSLVSFGGFQVLSMARKVSCDHQEYSASFNEFLTLVSKQRREEPDQYDLLGVFR